MIGSTTATGIVSGLAQVPIVGPAKKIRVVQVGDRTRSNAFREFAVEHKVVSGTSYEGIF